MSAPVMRPVPVTGAGVVINEAFDASLANQQDLLTYGQALETRLGKIEKAIQPVGGIDLANVNAGNIFTYSALGVNYWTGAVRRASILLGSPNLDTGGQVAVDVLDGTNRIAVLQPWDITAGTTAATRWGVTIYDFDPVAYTLTQVARALFAGESSYGPLQTSGLYHQALSLKWVGPNQLKVQTITTYPQPSAPLNQYTAGTYGKHAFTTLTLDSGAGTLTVVEDGSVAVLPRFSADGNIPFMARHRRRTYKAGAYGLATPWANAAHGNIAQPGYMLSERVGFGNWNPFTLGGFMNNNSFSETRITDELFLVAHEGRSPSSGGFGGRLSLARINDNMAGEVASKVTSQAVAGNMRVGALSASLFVAGWTTAGAFNSYVFTRDPATNVLDGAGVAVNQGEQGLVPVDYLTFSPTKFANIRISSGRTARVVSSAVDVSVPPPGNPFSLLYNLLTFDLGTPIPSSLQADATIIAAVERLGPDRILVVSRNATRNGAALEIFDLT